MGQKKLNPYQKQSRSFKSRVFDVVRKIKSGTVMTYKEVATKAGNRKASRAVGAILHTNFDPKIPCHRVVGSLGRLGGYNRGRKQKREILRAEGVSGM